MRRSTRRAFLAGSLALADLVLLSGCAFLPARMQAAPGETKIPRLGLLCTFCAPEFSSAEAPSGTPFGRFLEELRALGYVEGQNVVLEWRGADGREDQLPQLAAELVSLPVDLIVTMGGAQSALAARRATDRLPIVFLAVGDPVGLGLIASFPRPGGNVTGVSNLAPQTGAKRLELLKEVVPRAQQVDVVTNFGNPAVWPEWSDMQAAAPRLGIALRLYDARDLAGVEAAFLAITVACPDAIVMMADTTLIPHGTRILQLEAASRLPSMHTYPPLVRDGGLMSYGSSLNEIFRRGAFYVDRILRGARPADLPAEQPTRFDLVLNLKTAQALGLTIPESVRLQVTEVIE